MTSIPSSHSTDGVPTYTTGGASGGRYADYYPAWLDNLADDVTIEGSLLDGAALGPEAVRTIVGAIRMLYEDQQFNFAGAYGKNDWLEDYTAQVGGEPIGCAVLVTSNAAGRTQHVAANYRPRRSSSAGVPNVATAIVPSDGAEMTKALASDVLDCRAEGQAGSQGLLRVTGVQRETA